MSTLYTFRVLITSPCIICKIKVSHVRQIIFQCEMSLNIDTIRATSFLNKVFNGSISFTKYQTHFSIQQILQFWKTSIRSNLNNAIHYFFLTICNVNVLIFSSSFENLFLRIWFFQCANMHHNECQPQAPLSKHWHTIRLLPVKTITHHLTGIKDFCVSLKKIWQEFQQFMNFAKRFLETFH